MSAPPVLKRKISYPSVPTGSKGKKAKSTPVGSVPVYFKAFQNSPYRLLSNLFGVTEWKFQMAKFMTIFYY